jgi:PPOX class probable F420-dependent enzyme
MIDIPEEFQYLLKRETKALAHLAVILADGSPHVSPIWFDFDGTHFIFNTARGRVKDKAMKRHGMVAFEISEPSNGDIYILVRGPVVEETEENGYENACDLSEKYDGHRNFPKRPGQVRVIYKVLPEKVFAGK